MIKEFKTSQERFDYLHKKYYLPDGRKKSDLQPKKEYVTYHKEEVTCRCGFIGDINEYKIDTLTTLGVFLICLGCNSRIFHRYQ
jgi:hypothetical protein